LKKFYIAVGLFVILAGNAIAEEGGSGHYSPGSMASLMEGVVVGPAFISRLNVIDYDGSVGAMREIQLPGYRRWMVSHALKAYFQVNSIAGNLEF